MLWEMVVPERVRQLYGQGQEAVERLQQIRNYINRFRRPNGDPDDGPDDGPGNGGNGNP